eukprot:221220-Pyramimonas_sp.AAC.1
MSLPHRQTLRRSPPAGAAGAPRGTLFWGRTSQGIECRVTCSKPLEPDRRQLPASGVPGRL